MHCYRASASDSLCEPLIVAETRESAQTIAKTLYERALGPSAERDVKVTDRGKLREAVHGFSQREMADG